MRKVAIVCAGTGISGGLNVIYRQAMALVEAGVSVTLAYFQLPDRSEMDWHPIRAWLDHERLRLATWDELERERFDIGVCTWWETLWDLPRIRADAYVYFVQSIETRFYTEAERVTRAAVEASYRMRVGYLTEAQWIARYLEEVHGQTAAVAANGIDKAIYRTDGERIAEPLPDGCRVLVEGPVDVWFKNVPLSVRLAREGGADEVWLLTQSDIASCPGVDRVFSRVSQERTAAIYRSCDVVLKLSLVEGMFGPPLEMFHCGGTAVVYNVSGHDEYIRDGENAVVVPAGDEAGVRTAIAGLRADPAWLARLKAGALRTAAAWPDWAESGRRFHAGLLTAGRQSRVSREDLEAFADGVKALRRASYIETELLRQVVPPDLVLAAQEARTREAEAAQETRAREVEAVLAAQQTRTREVEAALAVQQVRTREVEAALAAQQARTREVEAELRNVLDSNSWRVTAPLRALRGLTRR